MKRINPFFSIFILLFLMVLLVHEQVYPTSVHGAARKGSTDHLVIGTIGSPSLFNPYFSADSASSQVESLLFNGLVTFDEKLKPRPDLAESWDVSSDGYNWTFHLRKGVKFHDGVEFTANDVVFSYSIPKKPGYAGPRGSDFEQIKSIRAVDRYTVQFTLKEPYAPFLSVCAYAILPQHLLKDVPIEKLAEHPFNTKSPIGTGPYVFKEWKDGQFIRMDAYDQFHSGKPTIQHVYFRIVPDQNAQLIQLQAGGIDVMGIPATDLAVGRLFEKQGKIKLVSQPSLAYTYIGYNLQNPLFQDQRVRQALTYAINRQQIVDIVLEGQGQVAHTHGSPLSWAYNEDLPKYDYNPIRAKQLLAEAGWMDTDGDGVLDKDGKEFSFILMTNQGNKTREMVSQIVQEQWAEIGVEAKPRLMEWSAFVNDYVDTKKFEAIILGWSLGIDPDPTAIWHSKEIASGLNFISYRNEQVDRLLEQNVRELDQAKRKEILIQFQKMIAEEQPYTFLYYTNEIRAYPPTLVGMTKHPAAALDQIYRWTYE